MVLQVTSMENSTGPYRFNPPEFTNCLKVTVFCSDGVEPAGDTGVEFAGLEEGPLDIASSWESVAGSVCSRSSLPCWGEAWTWRWHCFRWQLWHEIQRWIIEAYHGNWMAFKLPCTPIVFNYVPTDVSSPVARFCKVFSFAIDPSWAICQ